MQLDTSQSEALGRSLSRYEVGVNRQLIVAATGWGKTACFANIPRWFNFKKRGMILTHREKLAFQTATSVQEWNPHLMVGVEMADSRAGGLCNVVVGSVPTLGKTHSKRLLQFPPDEFDWIAPDEAHHSTSPEWRRCLEHFKVSRRDESGILCCGFTATPNRSDGAGLSANFDEIVYEYPIMQGIKDGILVDLRGVRVRTDVDLDGVPWVRGKFNDEKLAKEINTDRRNGIIVKEWMKEAYGLRTLIFTQDIQHAVDLAAVFRKCGVLAEAVWGNDPEEERKIAAHRAGELDVLLNAQLTIEGYDDPDIQCVVLATPDGSALRYAQKVGRVTRIEKIIRRMFGNIHAARAAGHPIKKEWGMVMDICDNCTKHSLQSLPSLIGLPKDLDLNGSYVSKAKDKFERVAREFPTADLSGVLSLSKLDSIAENISLFQVHYPPEIGKLSELGWRKSGDGYMLAAGGNLMTIQKDLRDEYQIKGNINGSAVEYSAQNLPGAFNLADGLMPREVIGLVKRDARWHADKPTEKQMALCRILKLEIPLGATKGQVSAAIDAKRAMMRQP